ncbi:M23 family metallopeptidase [Telluribacter sp. SYSU D00476]|uniref:M23 family metallopeptidase n=1 Tax=Telluribacter sp. SYSU D00476 TaxID=2811430 RepID=UPI001FF33230|nr:M23 family metallopeptidase [Telluribacter sp. SYSU D00476]
MNTSKIRSRMMRGRKFVERVVKQVVGIVIVLGTLAWKMIPVDRQEPSEQLLMYCQQFQQVYDGISQQVISPDSAERAFQQVMLGLRQTVGKDSCRTGSSGPFVYPLRGQLPRYSIGGKGRGYRATGFDLFDSDVRGSHPAQDLFIRDGDQDDLDDRSGQPVDVLAFTSGVVLATETGWGPNSKMRGGNYIWIYDPCLDGVFYYAHNKCVIVEPGQWVKAGEKIAEVGRTGYNAFKERSPTHLHLMFLRITPEGLPKPENTYTWLTQAEVVQ